MERPHIHQERRPEHAAKEHEPACFQQRPWRTCLCIPLRGWGRHRSLRLGIKIEVPQTALTRV
eukprot:4545761-Prymnesium_polylepis.3